MAKKQVKLRGRPSPASGSREPGESRASEAVTIAWTVSVTCVFVADLLVIGAKLYAYSVPAAKEAQVLEAIMLISAAAIGAVSLALLPVVWHVRRLKPPQGYVIFAFVVAAAPLIALVGRLLS